MEKYQEILRQMATASCDYHTGMDALAKRFKEQSVEETVDNLLDALTALGEQQKALCRLLEELEKGGEGDVGCE